VERIWRREGLKVPAKQPKRGGFGLPMAHASGSGRSIPTTCGPTTSSRIGPTMGESSAC
jgi:hypothetical protein